MSWRIWTQHEVSVPNQIQTQPNTPCMENIFFWKESKHMVFLGEVKHPSYLFIANKKQKNIKQQTTSLPYHFGQVRLVTPDLQIEIYDQENGRWVAMMRDGSSRNLPAHIPSTHQKRFGQKEWRCAWCIYLYYIVSFIVAYDSKGFS